MIKRTFTAIVWREGKWFIAQCLEVDLASQGRTEREAVENLRETLELYLEEPTPKVTPKIVKVEPEVRAT